MSLSPEDLEKKIREARAKDDLTRKPKSDGQKTDGSAAGLAMRMSVELVSALIVGGLLGYFIDRWLGTKPWAMLILFFLGFFAGFANIYRAQMGQDFKIGFKQDTKTSKEKKEDDHSGQQSS